MTKSEKVFLSFLAFVATDAVPSGNLDTDLGKFLATSKVILYTATGLTMLKNLNSLDNMEKNKNKNTLG